MKRIIDFTQSNFDKILQQGKRTTIRLGDKQYDLGGCDFTCEGNSTELTPVITELRTMKFNRLTSSDALMDGFSNIQELREELQQCYGHVVSDFDPVTVVRFEV